jgi:hypothetical protein
MDEQIAGPLDLDRDIGTPSQTEEPALWTEHTTRMFASTGEVVINYYFPVEVEIIGAGTADTWAEQIYDALQLGLDALA